MDADAQVEAFVHTRGPALMALARLLVRHPQDAEDLVQEALARCLPHWEKVGRDPEGYVRRTMVRLAIDRARRRRRRPESLVDAPERSAPERSTPDRTDHVATRIGLVEALRRLPARQRAAVVLRFYLDLDERTAAATMGCAVGTVKSLTSRALTALRAEDGPLSGKDG